MLGFYDVCKKKALLDNAVLPVLFLNTVICSLIFIPFIVLSLGTNVLDGTAFYVEPSTWAEHKYIILKACIVLSSWVFGYFAMKHLPITIVGPINATRPVMVLVGAMLVFGERLNVWQWIGVLLAIVSFFLLSRSGKKEGVNFSHNRWIFFLVVAAILGAVSGLYDKYLMAPPANGGVGLSRMVVQSWYNIYQLCLMGGYDVCYMVPDTQENNSFQVALEHHSDKCISEHCRLCLFLRIELAWRNDIYRVNDASRQCGSKFLLWCDAIQGEESHKQVG